MLYKLECLQTDLEVSEDSNSITNHESKEVFWNSFRSALKSNKRDQNRKTRILSIIANQFEYLQLCEKLQ
ncbi:11668_t:CDS:1, partial [Gigaspora rosea]